MAIIQIENIVIYSLLFLCAIVQVSVSIYVIFLMMKRRQIIREHRIDYLLNANIYIASLSMGISLIDMSVCSIYGYVYMKISFDGWWCKIKGYILYLSGNAFFHTFALQAVYRCFQILYRTQVRFQSFSLYIILIIGLWIFTSLELLPSLLIGDIEYISNDYHCQFSPTSIRGSVTIYSLSFVIPFSVTVFCYVWTMYNIRKQTGALITINRQANIHRDLTVLKRLMVFLAMMAVMAAPHFGFPILYIIIGYLPIWIVPMECTLTASALLAISIVSLFISPRLRSLRVRLHVVQPIRTITLVGHRRHRINKTKAETEM